MKKLWTLCLVSGGILGVFGLSMLQSHTRVCAITTFSDVENLFTEIPSEISGRFEKSYRLVDAYVEGILSIPTDERTFENTVKPLDDMNGDIEDIVGPLYALSYVSPIDAVRTTAEGEFLKLMEYLQEHVSKNKAIYDAVNAYVDGPRLTEKLSSAQEHLLAETFKDFKREGLHLSDDKLSELKTLMNKLNTLTMTFDKNIAIDQSSMSVPEAELAGVSSSFIAALKRDDAGNCILKTDYPTRSAVLDNCTVEATRRNYARMFGNRAYPINEPILRDIMKLRYEQAQLLGFDTYADYDLDNQMVKTPSAARAFLNTIIAAARDKQQQEFERLASDLPESVTLVKGKIKPWDRSFVEEQYKQKHLKLDDEKLSEYFPVDHVVPALLDIYQTLLGLRFEKIAPVKLWHEEATALKVIRVKDNAVLGYLLLDLYPRDNKYNHACHATMVTGSQLPGGGICPSVSLVIANFPRAHGDRPALFKYNDVKTFFHEFGHAMHAILGKTEFNAFAGTNVKRDFVETPSQMFEEWLKQDEILQKVSKHYQTGEPLPREMIDQIVELDKFDAGDHVLGQALYAKLALELFGGNTDIDIQELRRELTDQLLPNVLWDPETHMQVAFGHLTGYGAKYYGYLWSKVFALDLFETMKAEGLLSPQAGERLVQNILGAGGSEDPEILLKKYLGREPNHTAFMKAFGFED